MTILYSTESPPLSYPVAMTIPRIFALLLAMTSLAIPVRAIEVTVSAKALERTLLRQLFKDPEDRHYLRGKPGTGCTIYADKPEVSFRDDRVVVRVHARANLGKSVHGICLGVPLATTAQVSFIPEAEGETVGFRDARIEHLTDSPLAGVKDFEFLLIPFLSRRLPAEMKINAADLMRKLLANSQEKTGYALTLSNLKIDSMQVTNQTLILDADFNMNVD